jgi:hypothetical protein
LPSKERQSLEKEVERMAREMEAMKEQLRKSKEMNKAKRPGIFFLVIAINFINILSLVISNHLFIILVTLSSI